MRPEARDMFLANANATVKALGGTTFQDGINLVRKALAKLTEIFDSVQTPELLAKGLDELSVTPEQESMLIQAGASGPMLVRWIMMKLQETTTEDLPKLPSRRPAVSGRTQLSILRYVNDLHFSHGVKLEDAKLRAAQKHGCSVRTVERYWREREKILEHGPKLSFDDLLNQLIAAVQADIVADVAHASDGAGPAKAVCEPKEVPNCFMPTMK